MENNPSKNAFEEVHRKIQAAKEKARKDNEQAATSRRESTTPPEPSPENQ
jgi:hypothetical protein